MVARTEMVLVSVTSLPAHEKQFNLKASKLALLATLVKLEQRTLGAIIKSFLNGHGISQIHLPFLHFACIF